MTKAAPGEPADGNPVRAKRGAMDSSASRGTARLTGPVPARPSAGPGAGGRAAAGGPAAPVTRAIPAGLAHLIAELQGYGLRTEVPMERRQGGAGPADAGMLWVGRFAPTGPTRAPDTP